MVAMSGSGRKGALLVRAVMAHTALQPSAGRRRAWLILGVLAALAVVRRRLSRGGFFGYQAKPLRAGETRVCVVTGGASGIGRATVLRLEELGWHVLAVDFNEKLLKELDEATSERVTTAACDVSNLEQLQNIYFRADEFAKAVGAEGVAGLANVAGLIQNSPVLGVSDDQMLKIIAVNCHAPVRLTRLLMPLLLQAKQATICNVASIATDTAFPWTGIYSATKGFVGQYSEALRREAVANGLSLRVSVIKPGYINTPMTAGVGGLGLKWCDENRANVFEPGMRRSAVMKASLENVGRLPGTLGDILAPFGNPMAPMKTTPEHVTEEIVHSLTSSWPAATYFSASPAFKALVHTLFLMPASLHDLAMARMF